MPVTMSSPTPSDKCTLPTIPLGPAGRRNYLNCQWFDWIRFNNSVDYRIFWGFHFQLLSTLFWEFTVVCLTILQCCNRKCLAKKNKLSLVVNLTRIGWVAMNLISMDEWFIGDWKRASDELHTILYIPKEHLKGPQN